MQVNVSETHVPQPAQEGSNKTSGQKEATIVVY